MTLPKKRKKNERAKLQGGEVFTWQNNGLQIEINATLCVRSDIICPNSWRMHSRPHVHYVPSQDILA